MNEELKSLILVAHPESEILTEFYSRLTARGFSVATRASVIETLKFSDSRKPDVVLCGAGMPFFREWSLIGSIRDVSPRSRILLIASGTGVATFDGAADGRVTYPPVEEELAEVFGGVPVSEKVNADARFA